MSFDKCLVQARKIAEKAKPGFLTIDNKLYSFEFCQREWIYKVYCDGLFYVNFNTKSLNTAKRYLKEYLQN